jgi:cobalamin biosynthesis protein CbiG
MTTPDQDALVEALKGLVSKWRREALNGDENAREAHAEGLKFISVMSVGIATALREKAKELEEILLQA